MLGKAHKLPWQNNPKEYKKICKAGEYLVGDLWGPARIATPGGRKRFITFTDLKSDYTYTFIILKKSEQPDYFKQVEAQIERQLDSEVKHIHFDKGGEFLSNHFKEYFTEKGITYSMFAARTPEQISIAERKNRTLMDKTLSAIKINKIIKQSNNPRFKNFIKILGDFLLTITKIHSATPSLRQNVWMIPHEKFLGFRRLPRLHMLGSTGYRTKETTPKWQIIPKI
jgi:hypothetical protein